jgi:hypothetical protein
MALTPSDLEQRCSAMWPKEITDEANSRGHEHSVDTFRLGGAVVLY